MKDWTGNKQSVFATLAANNHSDIKREDDDFYATDPESLKIFLKAIERDGFKLHKNIWECACGQGHLSKVLEQENYNVWSTDLIDRGYGEGKVNFLTCLPGGEWNGDILTNPPYKYAKEFVEKAIEIIPKDYYVVMFLKIQFLEGQARRKLFEKNPPKYVYVNSTRQTCYINGDMSKKMNSASCYCWFIWQKGYTGETIVRWI